MPDLYFTMYEDEAIITYTSFRTDQINTIDSMLFCVNTDVPHPCIGDKELKKNFCHSECRSIAIRDSEHDFNSGDTLVGCRGMVELVSLTLVSRSNIPVICKFVELKIPALQRKYVFDRNNLLVENVTNHLLSRITTNRVISYKKTYEKLDS